MLHACAYTIFLPFPDKTDMGPRLCTCLTAFPHMSFQLSKPKVALLPWPLHQHRTAFADRCLASADIVYMVTGGSSLHQAYKLFGGTTSFGLSAWIVVFAATELLSCQVSSCTSLMIS